MTNVTRMQAIVSGSKAPTPTQNRIPSRQTNHICASNKIIYKRMNVAPDQTIILGLQIFLDHRSLSSIGQKIFIMPGVFVAIHF